MFGTLKNYVKAKLYEKIGVSFNPFGVPFSLGRYLKGRSAITLMDVGAFRGEFTTMIDHLCGVAAGILVEPQPKLALELRSRFMPPRFGVEEVALCDRDGTTGMEVNFTESTTSILKMRRELPELSSVDVREREKVVCQTTTLDRIFEKYGLNDLDLLKLDVQGAEKLVLSGAAKTLRRTKMIWTEASFAHFYENDCLLQELIEMLALSGFALYEVEPGFRGPRGALLQVDCLFLKS